MKAQINTSRSRLPFLVRMPCAGMMLLWSAQLAHADPKVDYASLFGEEEKRVLATGTTRDDAVFAAKLLARAADLKDALALQNLVLARAVELGQKDADGLATAVEAAKQIIEKSEGAEKLDWRGRLVDLYAAQYKRATGEKRVEAGNFLLNILQKEAEDLASERKYADAVKRLNEARDIARSIRSPRVEDFISAAKEMQEKQQTAMKYDRMRERLNTQGGDVALLEQVILGYLLELGDIETAKTVAVGHPNKNWERNIALLLQKVETLDASEIASLATWHHELFNASTGVAKSAALARALQYLNAYLSAHTRQDADRLRMLDLRREMLDAGVRGGLGAVAEQLVLWNTHNGPDNNYGAKEVNITLLLKGRPVWSQTKVQLPWNTTDKMQAAVKLPPILFDTVHIDVLSWYAPGGGLAEVQALVGERNLLLKGRAKASTFHSPMHGPQNVVDGTTSSADYKHSWIMKAGTPGWVQIELGPVPGRPPQ